MGFEKEEIKFVYPTKVINPLQKLFIEWDLTYWCNLSCPYCIQREEKREKTSEKTVENIAKKLREQISGKEIKLSLHGGEISTMYDLQKICKILFENNDVKGIVLLTTNLTASLNVYKDFLEQKYDKIKFKIIASYHWGNIFNFIAKAEQLKNNIFSVVDDTKRIEDLQYVSKIMREKGINFKFTIGRIPYSYEQYKLSENILQCITDTNKEYDNCRIEYKDGGVEYFSSRSEMLHKYSNFKGFYCVTANYIKPNGDVTYGSCFDRDKVIGNILKDNVSLRLTNKKCTTEHYCSLCNAILLYRGLFDES